MAGRRPVKEGKKDSAMNDKGCLNKYYNREKLEKQFDGSGYKQVLDLSASFLGEKGGCCELSHSFSYAYKSLGETFSKCDFVSDDSFEAMLEYHMISQEGRETRVFHNTFSPESLLKDNQECYDALYSFMGLSFDSFITLFDRIMTLLKIGGIFVYQLPAYWYLKDDNSEVEKQIISYSKQNEKKWLFINPLEEVVKEHNGELLLLQRIEQEKKMSRAELAYLSSLEKLLKAEQTKNKAHLDICDLPESLALPTAVAVIRKKKRVLTKDNIFNF